MMFTALLAMFCLLLAAAPVARSAADGPRTPPGHTSAAHGTIEGLVRDAAGTPLVRATITVEGAGRRTITTPAGAFRLLAIPEGRYSLLIEHIGYGPVRVDGVVVIARETVELPPVELKIQPFHLEEMVVTPGAYTMMGEARSSHQTLSSEDIKIMGWAEDVTRAVQRIPGTASDEYAAQFSIRGGEADEVLVLLDGMQVYKPFHQKDFGGGLLSTVDIETIDRVDLLTGGFTADYGERMSGVLSMKTKTPKPGERRTSLGLSLMNLRAFSMGSLENDKGTWLVSGRRSYLDLLDRLMGNALKIKPNYYDLLGKLQLHLSDRHTLSIHGFLADDAYKLDERVQEPGTTWINTDLVDTSYGNAFAWLSLDSFFTERLRAKTMLYSGLVTQNRAWDVFDDDPQAHLNSATLRDERDLTLLGVKQGWDYQLSPSLLVRFGVDLKTLEAKYDYSNDIRNEFVTESDSLTIRTSAFAARKKQTGQQAGLYVSSRLRVRPPLTLETGLRYDGVSYTNDELWSPRVSAAYELTTGTFLRAGWGYFYQPQGIDELDIQFGDVSFHTAERSEHYVLGLETLLDRGFHVRTEAYYKRMSNLRDSYHSFRDIDEFFPEARDDLIRLSAGEATARGVEVLIKRDTGSKLSWWLSYVLSEATDVVSDIHYDGRLVKRTGEVPRAWDQRHTFNIDTNYRLDESWHFNLAWKFRTGWPSTSFTVERKQREDGSFAYYHDHGEFRGTRVPSYHRLDARINRHFPTSRGKVSVFLHAINLYNHKNVIRYDHDILHQDAQTFRAEIGPETWFGITPFLGVSWEF